MISLTLSCQDGHQFASLFRDRKTAERLADAGHLSCNFCGSSNIAISLSAPNLGLKENQKPNADHSTADATKANHIDNKIEKNKDNKTPMPSPSSGPAIKGKPEHILENMSQTQTPMAKELGEMVKKLQAYIAEHSEHVGERFSEEARKIHDGEAEDRLIHGQANIQDIEELLEDGIAVMPLPAINENDKN